MENDGGREPTALGLMNEALALLDRDGEGLAAARLQHAIDALPGAVPPTQGADPSAK